jgi:PPIC-type peptidyl-prolyl cis-trans isomerase-like protein
MASGSARCDGERATTFGEEDCVFRFGISGWLLLVACAGSDPSAADVRHQAAPGSKTTVAVEPLVPASLSAPPADEPAKALEQPALGRWRLVDPSTLERVVLHLSHILIRYRDVPIPDDVPFDYTGWKFRQPPASRTRDEALRRALELATRARELPSRFAELAREVSEDPVTRSSGGVLGGVPATYFMPWPHLLDAFAETPAGGVSRVVETAQGFHIFLRHRAPPLLEVSGEHIVIGHEEAPWLKLAARASTPSRSRAEALALATDLATKARREPALFPSLVRRYSEHVDAVRGGDLGSWSNREISSLFREIDALSQLAVGEVSAPVDTVFGYQVLRRTSPRARARHVVAQIGVSFDPLRPDGTAGSRASALARARQLIPSVAHDPTEFARLQRELCCTTIAVEVEGRSSPDMWAALRGLRPGQVAPEPILYGDGTYLVVKRLPASDEPAPQVIELELPAPREADLAYYMRSRDGHVIQRELHDIAREALSRLRLSDEVRSDALRAFDETGSFADVPSTRRVAMLEGLQATMRARLGATTFAAYESSFDSAFELLMSTSGLWGMN